MSNPLIDAIYDADTSTVAKLISEGVNVNAPGEDGESALEIACSLDGGYPDIAQLLLDAGAAPTDAAIAGAAYANNFACVEMLLDAGASPNAGLASGISRDIQIVRLLLESGAVPDGGLLDSAVGCSSSIHFKGGIDRVKLLLQHGAPVNDKSVHPPLITAASNQDKENIALLLDVGADPARQSNHGDTALHWAALRDNCEIAQLLISGRAPIDAVDSKGRSPLIWAIHGPATDLDPWLLGVGGPCIEAAAWLIRAGANVELKDVTGKSAWEYAYLHNQERIVELIATKHSMPDWVIREHERIAEETRAEGPNSRDEMGRTPMHKAVLDRRHNKVRVLIEQGAAVNAQDALGQTPLMLAAQTGQPYMIERLINSGADVAARDIQSNTALHWAISGLADYRKAMRFLVERGANLNAQNSKGRSPLMAAAMEHKYWQVKALIGLGADLDAKDYSDHTALTHAVARKSFYVAQLLRSSGATEHKSRH